VVVGLWSVKPKSVDSTITFPLKESGYPADDQYFWVAFLQNEKTGVITAAAKATL
jgi:hypothetical protein